MQPCTKHVCIVKTIDARILCNVFHGLDAFYHARSAWFAGPSITYIRTHAPATSARFSSPKPWLSIAPLTDIERNGVRNSFESIAQTTVTYNGGVLFGGCMAIVALHNVHVPLGVLFSVYLLIAIRTKRASTSFVGCIGVKTKLHAFGVHIIGNSTQAIRKAFGVG